MLCSPRTVGTGEGASRAEDIEFDREGAQTDALQGSLVNAQRSKEYAWVQSFRLFERPGYRRSVNIKAFAHGMSVAMREGAEQCSCSTTTDEAQG